MKKNHKRIPSRRRTPWDESITLTPLQGYIKGKYLDHYDYHHPGIIESDEVFLLNTYKPDGCPYCGSSSFIKKGLYKTGLQRYRCLDCDRYFSILTGTIFEDHKIPISEWIEYLLNLMNYSSYELNAKVNKNAATTSKYWTKKVFVLLEDHQDDIILEGNVYIDEFYYKVIRREVIKDKDGQEPRGLSCNEYCIGIGYDGRRAYFHLEGKAKTSSLKTIKAFKDHIMKGSHLIHDGDNAHKDLIELLSLESEVHTTKQTKGLDDRHNPLRAINHICAGLRSFLDAHPGFNRDELSDYLNLYAFIINEPHDKLEKVEILLSKALNSRKTVRFRTYFAKKH